MKSFCFDFLYKRSFFFLPKKSLKNSRNFLKIFIIIFIYENSNKNRYVIFKNPKILTSGNTGLTGILIQSVLFQRKRLFLCDWICEKKFINVLFFFSSCSNERNIFFQYPTMSSFLFFPPQFLLLNFQYCS